MTRVATISKEKASGLIHWRDDNWHKGPNMSLSHDQILNFCSGELGAATLLTAASLTETYGPTLGIDDVAAVIKLRRQSLLQQLSDQRCEVPMVKTGKAWVITASAFALYLHGINPTSTKPRRR